MTAQECAQPGVGQADLVRDNACQGGRCFRIWFLQRRIGEIENLHRVARPLVQTMELVRLLLPTLEQLFVVLELSRMDKQDVEIAVFIPVATSKRPEERRVQRLKSAHRGLQGQVAGSPQPQSAAGCLGLRAMPQDQPAASRGVLPRSASRARPGRTLSPRDRARPADRPCVR